MAIVGMPAARRREIEGGGEVAGGVGQPVEQPVGHVFQDGRDIAHCRCRAVTLTAHSDTVEDIRRIGHERFLILFFKREQRFFL
jgi:hypothetical protein